MGAATRILPLRTPGDLEVVSRGLCRLPASDRTPFPLSARHLSFGTTLPARLSTPTSLTSDTTSSGGPRNAAHPDEDERTFQAPGRSRLNITLRSQIQSSDSGAMVTEVSATANAIAIAATATRT